MTAGAPLPPAKARALALVLLVERGFAEVARNTRGDSVYLSLEGRAGTVRVSSHPRTPKQRRNHPDALTSLVLRQPKTAAQVADMVETAIRNFSAEQARRERVQSI
ncbi:MAG TPA: hypothetical protein VF641_04570 [Methylobacterium sp.]